MSYYLEVPIAKRDCPELHMSPNTPDCPMLSVKHFLSWKGSWRCGRREVKVVTKATTKCNVYKDNSEDTGKVANTHKYR